MSFGVACQFTFTFGFFSWRAVDERAGAAHELDVLHGIRTVEPGLVAHERAAELEADSPKSACCGPRSSGVTPAAASSAGTFDASIASLSK